MENSNQHSEVIPNPPIETNYDANKENPGPSEEAVTQKNDKSAGNTMRWVIPVLIALLFIFYFIFFKT